MFRIPVYVSNSFVNRKMYQECVPIRIKHLQWNLPYPGGVGPGGARNSESAHN